MGINKKNGNIVINNYSPHYQKSLIVIWDYWRYSHKKTWWRCLLLALKMRSRVEQWYHHAQAPWCSAYGSQCAWFIATELDQWIFEWCFGFSQYMTVEVSDSIPYSPSIPCNHKHWVASLTTPLYSTSVDESAMALCFLLD